MFDDKAYAKTYRATHKEKIKKYQKTYMKKYRLTHREYFNLWHRSLKGKKCRKIWKQSPNGRMYCKINNLNHRGRSYININVVQSIYEDNIKKHGTLTCYLCLKPIIFGQDTLEHKIPVSRGGGNKRENLDIACQLCNTKKYNKTVAEYKVHLFCTER